MKLYVVHAPAAAGDPDEARASRTGFSFSALIFGPLWLLAGGLWLPLAGYALLAAADVGLALSGWLRPGVAVALFALGQLYLGFEGRALALAARERTGRPAVDVVCAHNVLEAEKIHLERVLDRGPAAPRRAAPPAGGDVIGSFPEPGR